MKYSVWTNKDNDVKTCVEGLEPPRYSNGSVQEDCEIFLYEIEATDYNDAMTKYHDREGWEKYIPMEEE
jgi:hypothetical protein